MTYFAESDTASLEFSLKQTTTPFPAPNLNPAILSLPPVVVLRTTSRTRTIDYFTVGLGSRNGLALYLQSDGTFSVRYQGYVAPGAAESKIYEIVLECWDFTSALTRGKAVLLYRDPVS